MNDIEEIICACSDLVIFGDDAILFVIKDKVIWDTFCISILDTFKLKFSERLFVSEIHI